MKKKIILLGLLPLCTITACEQGYGKSIAEQEANALVESYKSIPEDKELKAFTIKTNSEIYTSKEYYKTSKQISNSTDKMSTTQEIDLDKLFYHYVEKTSYRSSNTEANLGPSVYYNWVYYKDGFFY